LATPQGGTVHGLCASRARQDKRLLEKLQSELPGILAWAVRGCELWRNGGLANEPEAVKHAIANYRSEMDRVGSFLHDCCVRVASAKTSFWEFYFAYCQWAEANGEEPTGTREFGASLAAGV
jgi:putative DNA primase/helicase